MKKLLSALALSLGLVAGTLSAMNMAHASPAAPVAGTDYTVLQAAQPVDAMYTTCSRGTRFSTPRHSLLR